MLLALCGGGLLANVLLSRSTGQKRGWIVITAGWACGVTSAVYDVNALNSAHLNPVVTFALPRIGKFDRSRVPAARDLGPRLAHAFLPVPGKGTSDRGQSRTEHHLVKRT